MFKKFLHWVDKLIYPPKTEKEKRLVERHFRRFCKELESYPREEQIFVKDTIIRQFLGIAVGEL